MQTEEETRIHCTRCNGAGGYCVECGERECEHGTTDWRTCPYCCGQGTIDVVDASPEDRREHRAQMVDA